MKAIASPSSGKGKSKKISEQASSKASTKAAAADSSVAGDRPKSFRTVLPYAAASGLVMWAAFAPLGWSLLIFFAPLGLLRLIARDEPLKRGGYTAVWLGGCLFWLAMLQGIRLAYGPLVFGWIALSLYLAVYWPLFTGIARRLHHRHAWPLCVAAPMAWVAMELMRSYVVTGFAACTLAHSLYRWPVLIQIADQVGGYGVSFVIMSCSTAVYALITHVREGRRSVIDLMLPACLLCASIGYGVWQLGVGDRLAADAKPLFKAALIQENTPSIFDGDLQRLQKAWYQYLDTTAMAILEGGEADLVVWPESTFTAGGQVWAQDATPNSTSSVYRRDMLAEKIAWYVEQFDSRVKVVHDAVQASQRPKIGEPPKSPYLLVGNDAIVFHDDDMRTYNAAFLIGPDGKIENRYDKIHLVMFGEYFPFMSWIAAINKDWEMHSATFGEEPKCFEINGVETAPSICFETTLPQFIHWQLRQLKSRGHDPQVLLCITNDSWFRGSAILDHHLASEVLICVENRRPMLVAANTGLSAWIDGNGRIRQVTKRLEKGYIRAECTRDNRWGLCQVWSDKPAWLSLVVCVIACFLPARKRKDVDHEGRSTSGDER